MKLFNDGQNFILGKNLKLATQFHLLENEEDEENSSKNETDPQISDEDEKTAKDVLIMKYGHGMIILDDHVGQFNVKEVRAQVLKKMLDE